ncbi:MAG TPA: hypothetical protein VNK67_10360 [Burkholderiales bacterium]|nr:hypothetical protein [Burkholderiales bacterium]
MKYQIEKQGHNVLVRIDGVAGRERALIEMIQLCRRSAWACQSGECRNVATIEDRAAGGSVFLTLVPRTGAQINPSGVEICLRYALARFEMPAAG